MLYLADLVTMPAKQSHMNCQDIKNERLAEYFNKCRKEFEYLKQN